MTAAYCSWLARPRVKSFSESKYHDPRLFWRKLLNVRLRVISNRPETVCSPAL